MALTSDRLRELTKQRMELIRDIDKNPADESLREKMLDIVAEISKERHSLIANSPVSSSPKPAAAAEAAPEKTIVASTKDAEVSSTKAGNKIKGDTSSKKLSDYF